MTSLTSDREQLNFFCPVGDAQKDIKAVLDISVNAEPQRSDNEALTDIRENFSAELLYWDESIKWPIFLFRLLRDYPILKCFRYDFDRENQRIVFELANCSFHADNDKAYARQELVSMRTPAITGFASDVGDNLYPKRQSRHQQCSQHGNKIQEE